METLFDAATVDVVKRRIAQLRPDSQRQWGKMSPAQMLAHCEAGLQMATGQSRLPRAFVGRLIGGIIKPMLLKDGAQMRRNAPTMKELVVADDRDLAKEQQQLCSRIDELAAAGLKGCTDHPHPFFGKLTPEQWGVLMYKHLDHHLRQFSV